MPPKSSSKPKSATFTNSSKSSNFVVPDNVRFFTMKNGEKRVTEVTKAEADTHFGTAPRNGTGTRKGGKSRKSKQRRNRTYRKK